MIPGSMEHAEEIDNYSSLRSLQLAWQALLLVLKNPSHKNQNVLVRLLSWMNFHLLVVGKYGQNL
jgi:hypothetical protein